MIQFFHLKRQKKGSNLLRKLQLKVTINPFSLLLHCIYLSFYWYQILLETDLKIGFSEWKPKFLHSMCKFQLDINLIVVIVLFQSECASKDTVPIRATWFALIQLLLPSLFLFYLLAKKIRTTTLIQKVAIRLLSFSLKLSRKSCFHLCLTQ